MRTTGSSSMLKAKAIAGTHVVVLAWDLQPGQKSKLDGLLGFAIRRTELNGNVRVESYTMRSIKRFRYKDKGLPPGTPVSTEDHPLQTFQWGDYTANQVVATNIRSSRCTASPRSSSPARVRR